MMTPEDASACENHNNARLHPAAGAAGRVCAFVEPAKHLAICKMRCRAA
jgi:hypothetical protein